YFPLVIRASPPEGWPRGTLVVSENKVPYRGFLQVIGASPASEFETEIGEYQDNDPRIALSMLEEIALNCPLRENEAEEIKKEYETASTEADEKRPPLFVQGLISPLFSAFEAGMFSFSSALVLSLYTNAEVQWEIAGLGLLDKSPEAALKVFTDPFFPGDLLNRLAREPVKLKDYRSSFDRGPALADYLPYDSHDDGVFILKDGSLGMMWSLATITEEGLSEEERDRVRVAIEGVVMRIPAELACQIILVSSS